MITKFKLFETHNDVDPYGEEIWDEIQGFEIKKIQMKNGGYHYFASYHDTAPRQDGFFRFQGVRESDYVLCIGKMFNNGYSFRFYPLPDWPWEELDEKEKENFFNDRLKVLVFHSTIKDEGLRRDIEYGGDFEEKTFSEILKIFKITKDEFIMAKNQ